MTINADLVDLGKHTLDTASVAVIIGAIASWLPSIATLLSCVWFLIRIWESRTVQAFVAKPPQPPRD